MTTYYDQLAILTNTPNSGFNTLQEYVNFIRPTVESLLQNEDCQKDTPGHQLVLMYNQMIQQCDNIKN